MVYFANFQNLVANLDSLHMKYVGVFVQFETRVSFSSLLKNVVLRAVCGFGL